MQSKKNYDVLHYLTVAVMGIFLGITVIVFSLSSLTALAAGEAQWPDATSPAPVLIEADAYESFSTPTSDGKFLAAVNKSPGIDVQKLQTDSTVSCSGTVSATNGSLFDVVADNSGGAFVVHGDTSSQLSVTKVNTDCTEAWTTTNLDTSGGNEYFPRLLHDGSGGVYVAWSRASGADWDIHVTRLDSAGAKDANFDEVPVPNPNGPFYRDAYPRLIPTSTGIMVVYQIPNTYVPYAVSFDTSGSIIWDATVPVTSPAANYYTAQPSGSDGVNIAYLNGLDLEVVNVTSTGTVSAPTLIKAGTASFRNFGSDSDSIGNMYMAWNERNAATSEWVVYAYKLDPTFASGWTAGVVDVTVPDDGINDFLAASGLNLPYSIRHDGTGGAVLAMSRGGTSPPFSIVTQRLTNEGITDWDDGVFVTGTPGTDNDDRQNIISDGNGALVTWYNYDTSSIYAQYVKTAGVTVPSFIVDGTGVGCTANGHTWFPDILKCLLSNGIGITLGSEFDEGEIYVDGTTTTISATLISIGSNITITNEPAAFDSYLEIILDETEEAAEITVTDPGNNEYEVTNVTADPSILGIIDINLIDENGDLLGVLRVGQNEGMLHTFEDDGGEETFGIIPLSVIENIDLFAQNEKTATIPVLDPPDNLTISSDPAGGTNVSVITGDLEVDLVSVFDGNNYKPATMELDIGDSLNTTVDPSTGENLLSVIQGSVILNPVNGLAEPIAEATLVTGDEVGLKRFPQPEVSESPVGITNFGDNDINIEADSSENFQSIYGALITLQGSSSGSLFPSSILLIDDDDDDADLLVIPTAGLMDISCSSDPDTAGDKCFAGRKDHIENEVATMVPANLKLLDAAELPTVISTGRTETEAFGSVEIDGVVYTEAVNWLALAPLGNSYDGDGTLNIECGAQLLEQGIVNLLVRYIVNGEQMCEPPVMGEVMEENYVDLHIIDQQKRGDCDGKGSCKLPLQGAEIRVFDRADQTFIDAWGSNPSGTEYDQVYEGDIARIGMCTTDANGYCMINEEEPGEYLVIVKYYDTETDKTVYTGRPKDPSDFVDTDGDGFGDLATKDFQFIKVIKKNGDIEFKGGKKTVVVGSQLDIVYPLAAIWDEGVTDYVYPFIFTSDESWEVDVCSQVPQGYEISGIYDDNGDLLASSDCYQTFVVGETKVVAFEVIMVGSPPEWAMNTKIKVKHNGKKTDLDVDIKTKVKGKKEKKDKDE